MSSADNIANSFFLSGSGSKLFDILMVFLKYVFKQVDLENNQQTTESMHTCFNFTSAVC